MKINKIIVAQAKKSFCNEKKNTAFMTTERRGPHRERKTRKSKKPLYKLSAESGWRLSPPRVPQTCRKWSLMQRRNRQCRAWRCSCSPGPPLKSRPLWWSIVRQNENQSCVYDFGFLLLRCFLVEFRMMSSEKEDGLWMIWISIE